MAPKAQAAGSATKQEASASTRRKKNGPYSPRTLRLKKRVFLKTYPETLAISAAAEAAGVDRGAHYTWLENDPEYAQAFSDIEDRTLDHAEREVFSRGVVGWDEPVFHQGEICGHIRRKDTTCLLFFLKCRGKGRWNDRLTIEGSLTHTHLLVPAAAIDHVMARALELRKAGSIEAVAVDESAAQQERDAAPGNNSDDRA